jgi:D-alanyl-D-alanine dipeptidase
MIMTEYIFRNVDQTQIPIPEIPSVAGWKDIPIKPTRERLVPLGPFSSYWDIFTDSIYMGERASSPYSVGENEGSLVTQFVREDVADRLRIAQLQLSKDMRLVVFDAFRPIAVQKSLYDAFLKSLREKHPEYSEDKLAEHAQRYVSMPSQDPKKPSPHNTGGSVDIAIVKLPDDASERLRYINQSINPQDRDWKKQYALEMERIQLLSQSGQMLHFGTSYDFGGEEASLYYFERLRKERSLTASEQEALENRRLLYHIMRTAGFEPYPDEWWHFNSPKSQMGARTAGLQFAEYESAEEYTDWQHEKMRRMHRAGSIMIYEGTHPGPPQNLKEHMAVAVDAVNNIGDLRQTSLPIAEKMRAED